MTEINFPSETPDWLKEPPSTNQDPSLPYWLQDGFHEPLSQYWYRGYTEELLLGCAFGL